MANAASNMKVFTTSVKNGSKESMPIGEELPVLLDDHELVLIPPTPEQYILLLAGMEASTSQHDYMAGAINFIFGLVEGDDRRYLYSRLRDRDDDFGLDELLELIEYATEEWGGRPTEPSSDSSGRRQPTGKTSTARRRHAGSTRGVSPSSAG